MQRAGFQQADPLITTFSPYLKGHGILFHAIMDSIDMF